MGLMDKIVAKIQGVDIVDKPIYVKEFSDSNLQLEQLNSLLKLVPNDQKDIIEKEINNIKSGILGEKNISYELTNSRIPMLIIHNIRLEHKGLVAQFDYILVLQNCIIVLESKRLFGNINIDSKGNFIREVHYNNKSYKERIYSPLVQNERHINLLHEFLVDKKIIKRIPIRSIIVFANDKTIVNKKYAKKEVRDVLVNHDHLNKKIREYMSYTSNVPMTYKQMFNIASSVTENDSQIEYDFISMLGLNISENETSEDKTDKVEEINNEEVNDFEIIKKIRMSIAKKLNLFPVYNVFNNAVAGDIIKAKPKTINDLIKIKGLGEKKIATFGNELISKLQEEFNW